MEHNNTENKNVDSQQIAGAIIIAGLIIAGTILLKGGQIVATNNNAAAPNAPSAPNPGNIQFTPVSAADRTLGNKSAKITLVMYEDFQCPFCGAISGLEPNSAIIKSMQQRDSTWTPFMPEILKNYVNTGKVLFVYRDFPLSFLGAESYRSAEAARCAGDQGKFWEYHDYLFGHQKGEGQGAFSDTNLKSFAGKLGLDSNTFNQCLDSNKYTKIVKDSEAEGKTVGVTGTPKGFILKGGKVIATIDGAESLTAVKPKIDAALK